MFKLSSLDKAKLVTAWTNALKNEKVSDWARDNLPEKLKGLLDKSDQLLVGKWNGEEKIVLTFLTVHADAVTVIIYDPKTSRTETQDVLGELEDLSALDTTALLAKFLMDENGVPAATVDAQRISGEEIELTLVNGNSIPFLGGILYRNEKTGKLILVKPQYLKSQMKA